MKRTALLLLLLGLAVGEAEWGFAEEDDMVILSPAIHDSFIRQFDEVLVYYHSAKCQHCVDVEKDIIRVAAHFKETDPKLPVAKLDCREFASYCHDIALPIFPFLKLFVRQHPMIYFGMRSRRRIVEFVKGVMAKHPQPVALDQLEERLAKETNFTAIYVGSPAKRNFHFFDLVAKYNRNGTFLQLDYTDAVDSYPLFAKLIKPLNLKTVLVREGVATLCPGHSFEALEACVFQALHPNSYELTPEVFNALTQGPQRWMIFFLDSNNSPYLPIIERVSSEFKRKIKFIFASEETSHTHELSKMKDLLHVPGFASLPAVRIFDATFTLSSIIKYRMEERVNEENLRNFILGVEANHIKPFILTQTLEADEFEGRVQRLTGATFEKHVFVDNQDSVVLYHGNMSPDNMNDLYLNITKELAEREEFAGVKFFLIDGNKNEIRSFNSFDKPVLLLYSRRDPTFPRIYDRKPDLESIRVFIETRKTLIKMRADIEDLGNEL